MTQLVRLAILSAVVCASAAQAGITLVHAGKLFDADSGRMLVEQTIVIDGDRVKAVEADPLADLRTLERVAFVMQGGRVVAR